jgi:hypothetical protein
MTNFCMFLSSCFKGTSLLDIELQLRLIVRSNLDLLVKYQQSLINKAVLDVLSSDYLFNLGTDLTKTITLRLLLSANGASFFKTTSDSIWPLHAVILNLPPMIRQSKSSSLLVGLWKGKKKPNWSTL